MGDLLFLSPLSTLEGEVDGSEAYFSSIPCPLQKREGGWEEDYSSSVSRPLQREGGDLEDYSSPALIHSGGGGEVDGRRPIFPLPPLPPPVHSGGGGKVAGRRTTLPPILLHFGGREVAGMTSLPPALIHYRGGKWVGGRLLFPIYSGGGKLVGGGYSCSHPCPLWRGKVGWRKTSLPPTLLVIKYSYIQSLAEK